MANVYDAVTRQEYINHAQMMSSVSSGIILQLVRWLDEADAATSQRKYNDLLLDYGAAKARAEAAEQKLAEQRWIPVAEKLPEPGHRVLGLEFGGAVTVRCDRDGQFWTDDGRCKVFVELWRELPAAPPVEREG